MAGRSTSEVDIAHRVTRLRKLSRYIGQLESGKSFVAAAQLVEMAEKICGDYFTNRRELTGKDGAPLQAPIIINVDSLSLEEAVIATTLAQPLRRYLRHYRPVLSRARGRWHAPVSGR